jgi:hypothetical protein
VHFPDTRSRALTSPTVAQKALPIAAGVVVAAVACAPAAAKLNDIDPRAWLAHLLARLPDHPNRRISDLLPWNWRPRPQIAAAA